MYLLIVTGMSGAGKSTALNALEGLGYYCVDNLPSPMLPSFVDMCINATPPIERAAVTVDSRESLLSAGPEDAVDVLQGLQRGALARAAHACDDQKIHASSSRIFTSGSSVTPVSRRTTSCTCRISASTSPAVAPPRFTMNPAWSSET